MNVPQIELMMKDVFERNDDIRRIYKEVDDVVFGLMATYSEYKDGVIFQETADELSTPILKNVTRQTTRWSRASLAAIVAFIRNAGTIYTVLGRMEYEAASENNYTKQKEIKRKMKSALNSGCYSLVTVKYLTEWWLLC